MHSSLEYEKTAIHALLFIVEFVQRNQEIIESNNKEVFKTLLINCNIIQRQLDLLDGDVVTDVNEFILLSFDKAEAKDYYYQLCVEKLNSLLKN